MRTAYRVLAWILAVEVVVQAAVIAWAYFGLGAWIDKGGVLDAAAMNSDVQFNGVLGFAVHGINGEIIVPVVALVLFIVSFFAKVTRGVAHAGAILGMIILQIVLGLVSHGIPALGLLHGALALVILVTAVTAARLAAAPAAAPVPAHAA